MCHLVSVNKPLIDKECTFVSESGSLHLMYTTTNPDLFYLQSNFHKFSVYCHFPFVRTPSLSPSLLPPLTPHPPHPRVENVVGACHSVDVWTLQTVLSEHPASVCVHGVLFFLCVCMCSTYHTHTIQLMHTLTQTEHGATPMHKAAASGYVGPSVDFSL